VVRMRSSKVFFLSWIAVQSTGALSIVWFDAANCRL
jgi:hypothetical protein